MGSKNQIFLLLLLLLLTISSLPLSFQQDGAQPAGPPEPAVSPMADPKCDPQLKEICKLTKEPELCLNSYFIYTGEDKPDPSINNKAVLRKELEVGKKMSLESYTKSIGLSSEQYGQNDQLYELYSTCAKMFVLASNEYIGSKEALVKQNDVEKCKVGVNNAVANYKICDESPGVAKLDSGELLKLADICLDLANTVK